MFHQIALVSVKHLLTTTIIQEVRSCSEIMVHAEHELTVIVVVQCDFTATSAILIETMWNYRPGTRANSNYRRSM